MNAPGGARSAPGSPGGGGSPVVRGPEEHPRGVSLHEHRSAVCISNFIFSHSQALIFSSAESVKSPSE